MRQLVLPFQHEDGTVLHGCGHIPVLVEHEFPQALPDVARAALVHPQLVLIYINDVCEASFAHVRPSLFQGTFAHGAGCQCQAMAPHGAGRALGLRGCAEQGAQLHHRLVVAPRRFLPLAFAHGLFQQFIGEPLEELLSLRCVDGRVDVVEARQHAIDVAVHHGHPFLRGEAGDGGCRVASHAFQPDEVGEGVGEVLPAVLLAPGHHLLRCGVQVAGTAVVAQSLPQFQHLVERSRRQVVHPRVRCHKALVVVQPLCHACLLQDDLRKPYPVGILCVAPRQFASVLVEPNPYLIAYFVHFLDIQLAIMPFSCAKIHFFSKKSPLLFFFWIKSPIFARQINKIVNKLYKK